MPEAFGEIWSSYLARAVSGGAWLPALLGALAACALAFLPSKLKPELTRALSLALAGLAVGGGLALVIDRAALFDDAYISFRYSRNFAQGHGLVWNLGERVEGYTNFLWTVLIGAGTWLSGIEPAPIGLWLSIAVYALHVGSVYQLERTLGEATTAANVVLPIATALVAIQDSFVTAGSTGLETGFASWLVSLGLLAVLRAKRAWDWGVAGLFLILATLARPDHAIFYAVASAVLVLDQALLVRKLGTAALPGALRRAGAFAAPFLLYAAHMAYRLAYYGELVPNTFYAKSADQSYYEQGLTYAATFYLASHLWLLVPLVLAYAVWPAREAAKIRFKLFVGLSFVLFNVYVAKVGGDFMFGRFYVVLVPLVLLAAVQAGRDVASTPSRVRSIGYAVLALVGATAGGVQLLAPREVRWNIAEERSFYPVRSFSPLVIDHTNFRVAKLMQTWSDAGLEVRLATSAIGMIGYYTRLPVIDLAGLTDAAVAHQKIEKRGRPGHERRAKKSYIAKRNPHLIRRNYHDDAREALTRVDMGDGVAQRPWYIYHYDKAVMDRIAALTPSVRFIRFDEYLGRYIEHYAATRPDDQLREDDAFFRRYYFDHNPDPALLARWEAALREAYAR